MSHVSNIAETVIYNCLNVVTQIYLYTNIYEMSALNGSLHIWNSVEHYSYGRKYRPNQKDIEKGE